MRSLAVLLACVVALTAGTLDAQDLPALSAPVNDLAGVIDAGSATELDRRIRVLQTTTGDAVIVATVPTIEPYGTIDEYAVRLFERAGIGGREKDNGLLILLAVKERRVRVEVGYGLEEFVTDGFAGETIRQAMLPAFRQGRFGEGLLAGTTRIIQRIADRRGVTLSDVPREQPETREAQGPTIQQIVFAIIVLLAIINSIRRAGGGGGHLRRRGWPRPGGGIWYGGPGGFGGGFGGFGGGFGGGGGGGFGGFGGGRSGGGGASGGW
jgi:uncharacterized protein